MLRIGPPRIWSTARVAEAAPIAALLLSGCLQYSDVLTLQKDGSGTFAMDVKVDRASLDSAADMSSAMGGGAAGDSTRGSDAFDLPTRAELEAALAKGAPGVKLTAYRELSDEQQRGFHAEASFGSIADLALLHRTLADVESVGSEARVHFAYEKTSAGDWNFRRTMGSAESAQAMAMLPMLLGQSTDSGGGTPGTATPEERLAKARELQAALGQLMPGVGDLHMRFEVRLPGSVGQNNATLVHDQVALWEYDLAHLLVAASTGTLEMSAVVKP